MASESKIQPLYDRVIVRPSEIETKTAGGIVIPDTAGKDKKPMRGKVKHVGKGKYVDGKLQPLQVKEGDTVLFGQYSGTNIKLDNTEYLVLREEDIMAILED